MPVQADFIYKPISGQYPEKHFEVERQDFTAHSWSWVRFTKSDETEWVASFQGGTNDKKLLAILRDTPFVFVVAEGQGYLVNAETEELIKCTSQDTFREVASSDEKSLIGVHFKFSLSQAVLAKLALAS